MKNGSESNFDGADVRHKTPRFVSKRGLLSINFLESESCAHVFRNAKVDSARVRERR